MIRYEEFQIMEDSLKEQLERYDVGSEEYSRAMDSFVKLEKMRIEQQKADSEEEFKDIQMKYEEERIKIQKNRDKADLICKHSINVVEYLIGLGFSWKMIKFILRFEEEGSVRSFGGRQGLTKILGNFLKFK